MQRERFFNSVSSANTVDCCRLLAVGCVAAASGEKRAKTKASFRFKTFYRRLFWLFWLFWGDVVARRPRTMPLATMTMKTQTLGVLKFYPRMTVMGLRAAALRAAKELRY